MRKLIVCILLAVFLGGCGVWMNSEYSQLLDKTTALSHETAIRAQDGTLSQADMVNSLNYQADTWQRFRDARDGRE